MPRRFLSTCPLDENCDIMMGKARERFFLLRTKPQESRLGDEPVSAPMD